MQEAAAKDIASADSQMKAILDELAALSAEADETLSAEQMRGSNAPGRRGHEASEKR